MFHSFVSLSEGIQIDMSSKKMQTKPTKKTTTTTTTPRFVGAMVIVCNFVFVVKSCKIKKQTCPLVIFGYVIYINVYFSFPMFAS